MAHSLFAAPAKTNVLEKEKSFSDQWAMKYWGKYSGPQVASPSKYTTASTGKSDITPQNFDDLLTLGYKATAGLVPGVGVPFNLVVTIKPDIQIKPLYFGLVDAILFHSENLSIHADVRFYTPIGDVAASQDVQTGFRTSQVTVFSVPGSALTLGCSTFFRAWKYGERGKGFRNDLEFYLSPFARYPLSTKLSFTLWTDWLQLGKEHGKAGGFNNLPMDIQPGLRWDITSNINVNPYVNFIPANLSAINLGLVVNARML